jgi:hypothetical protein
MALAGVLAIPDELDTPDDGEGPDGQESEAMNPLVVDMINTGAKAIDDPANASAWMPFVIQGPSEYLGGIRHIPFEASNEQQVIQRTEAIMRLARGLDLPVEVVTGHSDTTYANAAQINIDVFRVHLEPTLQLICDALTVAYLWPALAKDRGLDPASLAAGGYPDDITSVAVTYDAHHLVSRPDRTNELIEVYNKDTTFMTIKIAEMRDALNLDPDEVVEPMEVAARVDAYRLGRIRETIAAPASDAAVGIESIDQAVIPGESAGAKAIEELGSIEAQRAGGRNGAPAVTASAMAHRVAGAIDYTVVRTVDKLGAKLRTKAKGGEAESWKHLDNGGLALALGAPEVGKRLGADVEQITLGEAAALSRQVAQWADAEGYETPAQAGHYAATTVVELVTSYLTGEWVVVNPASVDEHLSRPLVPA